MSLAGAATGAVGGAVVGGPIGAAVGGVAGAIVGGIADQQQPQFRQYVVTQKAPSYTYAEDVRVGAVLPAQGVTYYEVPAEYKVQGYRYTIVNDTPVLVEPGTRRSSRSSANRPRLPQAAWIGHPATVAAFAAAVCLFGGLRCGLDDRRRIQGRPGCARIFRNISMVSLAG